MLDPWMDQKAGITDLDPVSDPGPSQNKEVEKKLCKCLFILGHK